MKTRAYLLLCLLSCSAFGQNKINLRDVSFVVPAKYKHTLKENKKIEYDTFYENGKVLIDTAGDRMPTKIMYQYYELPGIGFEESEVVLKRLNSFIEEDFKIDTLIINRKAHYSVAKYDAIGKTIYEVKSLGEKGWLNVQYMDAEHNDSENLKVAESLCSASIY